MERSKTRLICTTKFDSNVNENKNVQVYEMYVFRINVNDTEEKEYINERTRYLLQTTKIYSTFQIIKRVSCLFF